MAKKKKEVTNPVKKKTEKPVNVYSEKEMAEAGFPRGTNIEHYDFSKSDKERKILKKAKYTTVKTDGHVSSFVRPYSPTRAKCIVQLRKNKTFPNTTYSKVINKSYIDDFITQFVSSKGKSLVAWCTFNGKRVI